jgi:hypothetical protein
MTDPITDETLAEIEAGLEGDKRGRWIIAPWEDHFGPFAEEDLRALIARLRAAEAAWLDPAAVHAHLCRYRILTRAQLLHLLGDDMQALEQRAVAAEDKIDRLESELHDAVRIAYERGMKEWARANYPALVAKWEKKS